MIDKDNKGVIRVALAGNPNVGKSTLFNSLTGLNVHTGNWAGKTVDEASADIIYSGYKLSFVDIPGAYSLFSGSADERVARENIIDGSADVIVIVMDASTVEDNLNLFLQLTMLKRPMILVLNLMDEAKKRGFKIDHERLSEITGIDVIPTVAHKKKTLLPLLDSIISGGKIPRLSLSLSSPAKNIYSQMLDKYGEREAGAGFISYLIRLLDNELIENDNEYGIYDADSVFDSLATVQLTLAREIASEVVITPRDGGIKRARMIDRILTSRIWAFPVMMLFLATVFFLTLVFASYPSDFLSLLFSSLEEYILQLLRLLNLPDFIVLPLVMGVYRTLSQVVAVMLPPMVIFFPFFSILEDSGYLPRVAYNLDRPFACVGTSGKQAITMCMGLGCNAVGVMGCRIMETRRERETSIITNSLMPCNGRLPMLISLLGIFWLFSLGTSSSVLVALSLAFLVLLSILATFLSTYILTKAVHKGAASSFVIELPPYRRPRFLSVIYHSLKDKCVKILFRAIVVSAPVGLIVWLLANTYVGEASILSYMAKFLTPFGELFGMDGAIILAFILAIPANEIVIPTLIMIYSSSGALVGGGIEYIGELFSSYGWTPVTALCTTILALFHFPCSTTLITIYKETKSKKATAIAFLLPTIIGLALAFLVNLISKIFI